MLLPLVFKASSFLLASVLAFPSPFTSNYNIFFRILCQITPSNELFRVINNNNNYNNYNNNNNNINNNNKKNITLFLVLSEMMPLNMLSFRACLTALQHGITRGGLYACHLILYACQSNLMQVRYPLCYKMQKV